jgi:thiamine pyrophosphokinase
MNRLRGASNARPALPDPDHTGGGILFFQPTILRREDGFILQRIVIFANGDLPNLNKTHNILRVDDFIICADGGTHHALALGLTPNLVVGDMDSIEKDQWQALEKTGVPIELFPRDKNETDLELAINRAIEYQPQQIIIIAALGGRLDQTMGNIALLTRLQLKTFDVRLDDGAEEIFFCRDQVQVRGRSGDIVSLIPWGNPVHSIQTQGLKWPLNSETLHPDKTRGISNEMLGETASIRISSGNLLVIHTRKS